MKAPVMVKLERPAARWLIALAFSCAVHGALVWEGLTLAWRETTRRDIFIPVELTAPRSEPREPLGREPAPPTPRPVLRPAVPLPSAPRADVPPAPRQVPSENVAPEPSETAPREATAPAANASVASIPPSAAAGARITTPARPRGGYQVRPSYPMAAREAGAQGTTLLRIHIEADGRVGEVHVQESAGHLALDQAAVDAVVRWRFEPARSGSDAVAIWVLIPVEFQLTSDF